MQVHQWIKYKYINELNTSKQKTFKFSKQQETQTLQKKLNVIMITAIFTKNLYLNVQMFKNGMNQKIKLFGFCKIRLVLTVGIYHDFCIHTHMWCFMRFGTICTI